MAEVLNNRRLKPYEVVRQQRQWQEKAIDKEWERLDEVAAQYGDRFAATFEPSIQDQLPLGDRYGYSLSEHIYNERIEANSDRESGIVGGDVDFVKSIESQAWTTGFLGHNETGVDRLDCVEEALLADDLANEYGKSSEPTTKTEGQQWYIKQFTRNELASRATYWYKLGAETRLVGNAEERRVELEQEKREEG